MCLTFLSRLLGRFPAGLGQGHFALGQGFPFLSLCPHAESAFFTLSSGAVICNQGSAPDITGGRDRGGDSILASGCRLISFHAVCSPWSEGPSFPPHFRGCCSLKKFLCLSHPLISSSLLSFPFPPQSPLLI